VFAIARPYIKTNFEAIVEALPITVGILAAMRRLWPIENISPNSSPSKFLHCRE
jgi:hypothetical protein